MTEQGDLRASERDVAATGLRPTEVEAIRQKLGREANRVELAMFASFSTSQTPLTSITPSPRAMVEKPHPNTVPRFASHSAPRSFQWM